MPNTPHAIIDLGAIQHNLDLARALAPKSKVMAIVKAEAYGHGAVEVSRHLNHVDAFGVARVHEGIALREAGIESPIVVLEGFLEAEELNACRIDRLTPVLHSDYQIALLNDSKHADLPVWLKVDTGMHRLGFSVEEFEDLVTHRFPLNVLGVMSHLANADNPDHKENHDQIEIFSELTRTLSVELSIANSGAIMNHANSHFDWIRPGIMLYGGSPSSEPDDRLQAAMTLTAPILAINRIARGESIGYGSQWLATSETRIAVLGIGYADGYPREMPEGTPVLVNGERRSIVGRISMDMMFVELDPSDSVEPKDTVVLWGRDLPIDEVASFLPTIGYTLMSRLTSRVSRVYEGAT